MVWHSMQGYHPAMVLVLSVKQHRPARKMCFVDPVDRTGNVEDVMRLIE